MKIAFFTAAVAAIASTVSPSAYALAEPETTALTTAQTTSESAICTTETTVQTSAVIQYTGTSEIVSEETPDFVFPMHGDFEWSMADCVAVSRCASQDGAVLDMPAYWRADINCDGKEDALDVEEATGWVEGASPLYEWIFANAGIWYSDWLECAELISMDYLGGTVSEPVFFTGMDSEKILRENPDKLCVQTVFSVSDGPSGGWDFTSNDPHYNHVCSPLDAQQGDIVMTLFVYEMGAEWSDEIDAAYHYIIQRGGAQE